MIKPVTPKYRVLQQEREINKQKENSNKRALTFPEPRGIMRKPDGRRGASSAKAAKNTRGHKFDMYKADLPSRTLLHKRLFWHSRICLRSLSFFKPSISL